MMANFCFLNKDRACTNECVAHVEKGATNCRLLNTFEKLVPVPTRPIVPPPTVTK